VLEGIFLFAYDSVKQCVLVHSIHCQLILYNRLLKWPCKW